MSRQSLAVNSSGALIGTTPPASSSSPTASVTFSGAPGRASAQSAYSRREIMHIRHHSLYTPRDFDLSPYFHIVKPTLAYGFDYKTLEWAERKEEVKREEEQGSAQAAERKAEA